ncbi:MAG: glycoside hydrolase family 127 protein [Planctomycetota bacterium]
MRTLVRVLVAVALLHPAARADAQRDPVPFAVPAGLPDAAEELSPARIRLDGWLGRRARANARARLANVDLAPLLDGFRHRPGVHPWIGEHIGKWMHAATLAWAATGDAALRQMLDGAARALHDAQEADGYLGTYVPEHRFGLYPEADWDVWSHKYCLLGLLTYHRYTGDRDALATAVRAGDLLLRTFGPGHKSILAAGTHLGMAATSVLEPMVLLHRLTGDARYLAFCRYLVAAWDEPGGPGIAAALLAGRGVDRTANAKAYEMLSNLVGLCELARDTGDRDLLRPVLAAWQDIVANRLYLTGSASQGEHFHGDHELPNGAGAHVAETCVTVTWLQLNAQLLRLLGEARFGEQLERTLYNHLAAAQRPDGAEWCYFTALDGTKPYGPGINCCVSSGPRGMAMAAQQTWLVRRGAAGAPETLLANLLEDSRVEVDLGGATIEVRQSVHRGADGGFVVGFAVTCNRPATFALAVRMPPWAGAMRLVAADAPEAPATARDGWLELPARQWRSGDRAELTATVAPILVPGTHGNAGLAAWTCGPFVLAYDQRRDPGGEAPAAIALVAPPDGDAPTPGGTDGELVFAGSVRSTHRPEPHAAVFVPFADAGGTGGRYRVWLRAPGTALPHSDALGADGDETRSREGNVDGSFQDGDPGTFVVTFDGTAADVDWFAVAFRAPTAIRRVVFAHGRTFHDGGWFDASGGKPRVEIKRSAAGDWQTAGELADYPATTATDAMGLAPGQTFALVLPADERVVAIRVIGKPACGDNPRQAFSSCAELQAFAK